MRCVDVIRELSTPTGDPESAPLAEHLDRCPQCAAWARRDARLGRLWEATRPPELSEFAWERIWANISDKLDRPTAPIPAPRPSSPRNWRRLAIPALIIAQAAAVLISVTLLWRLDKPNPAAHAVADASETPMAVESPEVSVVSMVSVVSIDQGQNVVIELGGDKILSRNVPPIGNPNGVDDTVRFWNRAEALDEAMASLR